MANQTGPFASTTKASRIALILTLVVMGLACLAALTDVVLEAFSESPDLELIIPRAVFAVGTLVVAAWALVAFGLVRVMIANEVANYNSASRLERLDTAIKKNNDQLKQLHAMAKLSDGPKSLLCRPDEMEAFREAIHRGLTTEDYDGVSELITKIEELPGYAAEAKVLRAEAVDYQDSSMEQKVQAAVARVQRFVEQCDWGRALQEAQRLGGLFGGNETISELPKKIHIARAKHKRDLLQAYGEATRKNDVDRSIELLKELDAYLTPQEASALSESARGVFKARLNNLGVQFAIYVEDEQWADAIAAGQQIVREFPNSRMAQEVKQKTATLEARAESAAKD
jgi:hypothetical protein